MTVRDALWLIFAGLATGCVGAALHAVAPQIAGFGIAAFVVFLLAASE